MLLVGSPRVTGARTIACSLGALGLFVKVKPSDTIQAELRGLEFIRQYLPAPKCYGSITVGGTGILFYQLWPTTGLDSGLMVDVLNRGNPVELSAYADDLTAGYRFVFLKTVTTLPSTEVVRDFFEDRALPSGRLRIFYQPHHLVCLHPDISSPRIDEFATLELTINGKNRRLDWISLLDDLQQWAQNSRDVLAVVSQGDPTEVNLASPFGVFDCETAGFNPFCGEVANFCWSIAAHGCFLSPKYHPPAVEFHPATFSKARGNSPHVRVCGGGQNFDIAYTHAIDSARQYMLRRYLIDVAAPILHRQNISRFQFNALVRPYLILRIIGPLDVTRMTTDDAAYCVSRLAECVSGDFDFIDFFNVYLPGNPLRGGDLWPELNE